MIRKTASIIFIIMVTFIYAQEMIRGTYSYTYGDSESLVQARQTCKNLALRDAIESYYIFIESTTTVENSQTKDDLIQSIATGIVQNLKIIEQQEVGKTISLSVEGTVNPDQVKQLVEKKMSGVQTVRASSEVPKTTPQVQPDTNGVQFNSLLSKYENKMSSVQNMWNAKKFDSAINQIQEIQQWLEKNQSNISGGFNGLLFQSIQSRNKILTNLMQIEKQESLKRRTVERMTGRNLRIQSDQLEKQIQGLARLADLSDRQKMVRKWWTDLCRITLAKARSQIRQSRN